MSVASGQVERSGVFFTALRRSFGAGDAGGEEDGDERASLVSARCVCLFGIVCDVVWGRWLCPEWGRL